MAAASITQAETAAAKGSESSASPQTVENSVVKVFSVQRPPDVYRPWTKQGPKSVTASGVVIEGHRILTNAHVVAYASEVQVQPSQSGDKISATVEAVAPGMDLAVLKLEDDSFFDAHPPLPRSQALPDIRDTVIAYGYPVGGTGISSTKGIISRIEFVPYFNFTSGLRIQIDAAINPGNSGGPAMVGDRMIGLAYSHLVAPQTQSIGYIIPDEEIDLFLKSIPSGRYRKPMIYGDFQPLENPALRKYLQLDRSLQGTVVRMIETDDPNYPLKPWDVITQIGGTPIDDEGMIALGSNLRLRFSYLIQKIAQNGTIPLTVVRSGKKISVMAPVSMTRPELIPELEGEYPLYFIYGPLVFSAATAQFVGGFSGNPMVNATITAMGSPLVTRRADRPTFLGEQLVVVSSPFLPNKLATGYGPPVLKVVQSVNGTKIKNLRHLVEVLRDSKDELLVIEFCGRGSEALVFPRKEMVAATESILADNGIRAQASADLLQVWNAKSVAGDASNAPAPSPAVTAKN